MIQTKAIQDKFIHWTYYPSLPNEKDKYKVTRYRLTDDDRTMARLIYRKQWHLVNDTFYDLVEAAYHAIVAGEPPATDGSDLQYRAIAYFALVSPTL
jgi:hypothetical protein